MAQSWIKLFLIVIFLSSVAHGLQCYKCNSTATPDCAINPSEKLEYGECPQEDTECVMAVLDDMATYRGCASEIDYPDDCDSCLNTTCTGDLCNGVVYPENRLRCHKCEKNECVTVSGDAKPCLNYVKSELCYVDVIDETDVVRGCTSDYDYNAGYYSYYCFTDGCNSDPAVSQFSCLSCDSDKDENCKRNQNVTSQQKCEVQTEKVCTIDVLLGRSENCYTYHEGEHIIRGCARLDPDVVMKSQYISTCRSSNCNKNCISSQKCKICDSQTDANCRDDISMIETQECPEDTSSCFTCKLDDNNFKRGCGNATESSDQCLSCWNEEGCNSGLVQACYQCNSATNRNCARWGHEEYLDMVMCPGQCVVKVTDDDYTVRGCRTGSLSCFNGEDTCKICDTHLCNAGVYPPDRILCHQCDETDSTCDYEKSYVRPLACAYYEPNDQCFQFINGNGKMIRGCKSDVRYLECKSLANGTCTLCDKNGCNKETILKEAEISCMSCQAGNKACAWSQLTSKKCPNRIPFSAQPTCFTRMLENNTVVRGCIGDTLDCEDGDENCETCKSNGCNSHTKVFQNCVQCTSTDGTGPCAQSAYGLNSTQCPGTYQFYDSRGCYVRREDEKVVKRGCISELNTEVLQKCVKDGFCVTCLDQSCNYQRTPSSANDLTAFSLLLLLLVVYTSSNV